MKRLLLSFGLLVLCGGFFGASVVACWPTEDPTPVRVRMLYDIGGKGDLGWNDQGYLGLIQARTDLGAALIEATPQDVEDASTSFFRWLADPMEGYREVVVAHSALYEHFVDQAQCFFGDRRVILFDGKVVDCGAVKTIEYRTFPLAFKAGYIAMRQSQSKKLGIVAGASLPYLQEMAEGFRAGADYAAATLGYPEWSCSLHFIPPSLNGLVDPTEATKWANLYWDKGVDVIFTLSGASNFAVIETAKEAPGRRVVASDSDQESLGKNVVLGSVVRRNDLTLTRLIGAMWAGGLGGGHEVVSEASGEVQWAPNPAFAEAWVEFDEDKALAEAADEATSLYLGEAP